MWRHLVVFLVAILAFVSVTACAAHTYEVRQSQLYIDGKKEMPIAFWTEGFSSVDQYLHVIGVLSSAGFDAMYIEHDVVSQDDFARLLDEAKAKNIRFLVDFYNDTDSGFVARFKDRREILTWSVADDGNSRFSADQVKAKVDQLKQLDSSRPALSCLTTGLFGNDRDLQTYTAATTIPIIEWYPVQQNADDVPSTYEVVSRLVEQSKVAGTMPGAILQTYNWGRQGTIWPTAAQTRAQSYASLIGGAQTIDYYTLKDYSNGSEIDVTHPDLFDAARRFASEFKTYIKPLVLDGTMTRLNAVRGVGGTEQTGNPSIKASVWKSSAGTLLLAVNLDLNNSAGAHISLPGGPYPNARPLFDGSGGALTSDGQTLSGTMQPLDTIAFLLDGNGQPNLRFSRGH